MKCDRLRLDLRALEKRPEVDRSTPSLITSAQLSRCEPGFGCSLSIDIALGPAVVPVTSPAMRTRRNAGTRTARLSAELRLRESVRPLEHGDHFRPVMSLNEWAFCAKHIPGSEHFNTPADLLSALRPDEEIVEYCTSSDCHASVAMYWALTDAGCTNVRRYAGGLTDRESARHPLGGDWA